MALLFGFTLFVSATLLFLVQPMIAKMILPRLGGSPAVWNTCMVFFQAALLGGYAYAHATTTWLGVRRQAVLHAVLLFVPLALFWVLLPIGKAGSDWVPPESASPIGWVLLLLLVMAGLPFFIVSASAPLLQKWFANTNHPAARDPYFLYAASNLGSMLALLAYPTLVEPYLRVVDQRLSWTVGYILLVAMTLGCARYLWSAPALSTAASRKAKPSDLPQEPPKLGRKLHWIALAAVPSSLLLGVTTYVTTDIAAIPLLWILPLALYLLSFILVFADLPLLIHKMMVLTLPVLVLVLVFMKIGGVSPKYWMQIVLHLVTLFVVAMVCHGELVLTRPAPAYLTGFYLWMSLGGMLGGMFNALVAPLIFSTVAEYHLAMVFACLLMPALNPDRAGWLGRRIGLTPGDSRILSWCLDFTLPMMLACLSTWLIRNLPDTVWQIQNEVKWDGSWLLRLHDWFVEVGERELGPVSTVAGLLGSKLPEILKYGLPTLLCYLFVERPLRFALGVAVLLVTAAWGAGLSPSQKVLLRDRSFFGVLAVKSIANGSYHQLSHGTTLHGEQRQKLNVFAPALVLEPLAASNNWEGAALLLAGEPSWSDKSLWNPRGEPLTYYHRTGPVGLIVDELRERDPLFPYAVVGLGTGSMAAYAERGQSVTYYEIDPAVKRIAYNPDYFTYIDDALKRGANVRLVMGDARLQLARDEGQKYQFIGVDAFSSDAIPVHLITLEAVKVFLERLDDKGILAFHISNRHLDLKPVLGNLAKELHLVARYNNSGEDDSVDRSASTWVILGRSRSALGNLADAEDWKELPVDPKVGVWTDDYSNLLSVFNWR